MAHLALGTSQSQSEPADLLQQLATAQQECLERETERDGVYQERAHLLAWLASLSEVPAVIAPATDVDEPGWQLLYLTLPWGQLSWHIAPRDAALFQGVEQVPADDPRAQWDGHTTEEKYRRIREAVTATPLGA